jgi:Uma2 family endonuclease
VIKRYHHEKLKFFVFISKFLLKNMAEPPKDYSPEIDLENLDLERSYTLEEFEYINSRLRNYTLEIDGQPVNLFELNENGKLVPMPETPCIRAAVVAEIARQIANWNVLTRQGGVVTTSQGGYNFTVDHSPAIRAPDVSFVPQNTFLKLTDEQRWSFQGAPFTPIFVVEVHDIGTDVDNSKFQEVDRRFKDELITISTSVQLGWLIDPQNKQIHIYRRNRNHSGVGWGNLSGENVLPGFELNMSFINRIINAVRYYFLFLYFYAINSIICILMCLLNRHHHLRHLKYLKGSIALCVITLSTPYMDLSNTLKKCTRI